MSPELPPSDLSHDAIWSHCAPTFRGIMHVRLAGLDRQAWALVEAGFDPIDLTIVECRRCGRSWVAPLASSYPHDCTPLPDYSPFVVVPAFRPVDGE